MTERRAAYAPLAAGLAALYALMFALSAGNVLARAPRLMGTAVTIDLTLTAALATWLLGSRRGRLPRRAPWTVLALGLVAARVMLPANAREGLGLARFAWAALELAMLLLAVAQLGRIRRRMQALRTAGADFAEALEGALAPALGSFTARMFATELGVLAYATTGWWRATPAEDARTFSMHRRSHHGVVVGVLVFLIAVESTGLHLLVARGSPPAAWALSASSLWLALWLIGDAQALRLLPLRLASDGMQVTVGIRWRVRIPYDAVRVVALADGAARTPTTLAATVTRGADVQLDLARPLRARGLFGRTRHFDRLLLTVDRPDDFVAALEAIK